MHEEIFKVSHYLWMNCLQYSDQTDDSVFNANSQEH